MNRRQSLKNLGIVLSTLPFISTESLGFHYDDKNIKGLIEDEAYWQKFAQKNYTVSDEFINLENGYFGVQPIIVLEAYQKNVTLVNQHSSKFMRQEFYQTHYPLIKQTLATLSGASEEELLVTRNATEALNILIQGIQLNKGDEVILQRHDYHSMIETFQMLEKEKGIVLKFVDVPLVPKSCEEIIALYEAAISARTKCILLTHLTHLTGQIMPVNEISKIAKSKGIDVIVDAAHSFAQIDYKLPDLYADFIGVNLHKWFGNPLGAGLLYVRKDRIKDLKPLYGDHKKAETDINKLGHLGTPATPILMTIPAAASFNSKLTNSKKENRLRYLKNYWTSRAKKIDRVMITTPMDKEQSCALASFKMDGVHAKDIVKQLDENFNVFTVIRKLYNDTVIRVTPNLYNSTKDLDRLLEGLTAISKA